MWNPCVTARTDGVDFRSRVVKDLRASSVGAALRRTFVLALTVIALALALALAVSAGARTLAPSVKPSLTAAKAAVRKEVVDHDPTLLRRKFQSECVGLSDTLYRCWWDARNPGIYEVWGNARIRFYKYGPDVALYRINCSELGDDPLSDECVIFGWPRTT